MKDVSRLVSIKNPVFDAFDDMGIDITNDVPVFTSWAVRAAKDIGNLGSKARIIKVVDVVNCQAKIPTCMTDVQYVVLGDYGCDCEDLFKFIGATCSSTKAPFTTNVPGTSLY